MAYLVPLRFVKVSNKRSDKKQFDVAICATRIVAMMSTEVNQARKTISQEKKKGSLINACGLAAAKTAIFLDNGAVVSSPLTIPVLLNSIEKANSKAQSSRGVTVYEVEQPETDEWADEMSTNYDVPDEEMEEM